MGDAIDDSVIDKWNASHEIPNLTILGGSAFPHHHHRLNPTLTIMAVAWRAGDHMVAEMKGA